MSECNHEWVEGNYEAGEEDYCSRCSQSRKDIRIAELELEVQKRDHENHLLNEELKTESAENARLLEIKEAARCIRHWHDSGKDGMVVSADHVRLLWAALKETGDE